MLLMIMVMVMLEWYIDYTYVTLSFCNHDWVHFCGNISAMNDSRIHYPMWLTTGTISEVSYHKHNIKIMSIIAVKTLKPPLTVSTESIAIHIV
jgi:hypothetical protein